MSSASEPAVRYTSAIDPYLGGMMPKILIFIAILVSACASPGPTADPLARVVGWFAYVAGDDLAAACRPGTPVRYRAVYNARYTKQVRTYDLAQARPGESAVMTVRAFKGTVRLLEAERPEGSFVGVTRQQFLNAADFEAVGAALQREGAFAWPDRRLFLHSNTYYWVVSACQNGRFSVAALKAPPEALNGLEFARVLFRLDNTGADIVPAVMTEIDRLTRFGQISESPVQQTFVTFQLIAGPGGIE